MEIEKRYYWFIAAVVSLAIVLFAVGNQVNSNRKQQINAYILENISFKNHAWNGIIVAETTEEEVENILFSLDHIKKSSIITEDSDNFTYFSWSWNTSPTIVNSSVRCENGVVDLIAISFSNELTVKAAISDFGYPDEVYVSPVGNATEYQFWALTLYYLEEGVNIGAYSRKPQKTFSLSDKVQSIELFMPDEISTAEELAHVYSLDISDIAGILPAWLPTKDKQLFESYLELFRQKDEIPYGPKGIFQTSGFELGMFIANQQVKLLRDGTTYDRDGVLIECPPNSYGCTIPTSPDPNRNNHIFINGLQGASVNFHTGAIAHEAFHLSLPFNTNQNSLYEEMTAIAIGYTVSDGENSGMYISVPPLDLTSSYSEGDIIGYITAYCGDTCSYLELPTYPDTWEGLLQTIEAKNNGNE